LPISNATGKNRKLPEWMPQLRGRHVVVVCNDEARSQHRLNLLRWAGIEAIATAGMSDGTGFPADAIVIEDNTDFRCILKLRDTWPATPALMVRGVAGPEARPCPCRNGSKANCRSPSATSLYGPNWPRCGAWPRSRKSKAKKPAPCISAPAC
jgi:hypothetical protein